MYENKGSVLEIPMQTIPFKGLSRGYFDLGRTRLRGSLEIVKELKEPLPLSNS